MFVQLNAKMKKKNQTNKQKTKNQDSLFHPFI